MQSTILSFDPGGTTGWFGASFTPDGEIFDKAWGQITGPEHHQALYDLIAGYLGWNLRVVYEDYRPEFARAQNYVALEYIGVIKLACANSRFPVARQERAVKNFWTSARLQKVDCWPRGQVHAQDASRHWLAFACKQYPTVKAQVMASLK